MDGVIVINKPKNITSNGVVQKVRKALNIKQVGHCGTLDPLATGVLPILVGQGTKISKYLVEHDKTYIATIQLGVKTSTADSEGDIIENRDVPVLDEKQICNTLLKFKGESMQTPPMYSAIKKDGKKLYEYARLGQSIEIEPREIFIYEIKLLKWEKELNQIVFEVTCSKGTYIRSLCEDIAQKNGTIGFMKELIRTRVDEFIIDDSVTLEKLEAGDFNIVTIEDIFKTAHSINLEQKELSAFLNGVLINNDKLDGVYRIYNNDKFIGLGVIKNKLLKRDVIV
ncbi:MAG: tRNA pseudouridine(55) synthase TruB [Clostridia bacterium]|nr:tRNA pseudouridine(55) synthase TruB [Clostridia bacterium]